MTVTSKVKLAFKLEKCLFSVFMLRGLAFLPLPFTFELSLFIDHVKVLDEFETGDLDLQCQIFHESLNVCLIPCEHFNF